MKELFSIKRLFKIFSLRKRKVILSFLTRFDEKTEFEGRNSLGRNTNVKGTVIGFGTYIGADSILNQSSIGKFCSISKNVEIVLNNHPTNYISTHPAFHRSNNKLLKNISLDFCSVSLFDEFKFVDGGNQIVIENDVWIGCNVILMPGIKIANGAIVAAGSVVTKSVEPYTIVGGVPAKVLKKRFHDEEVEYIMKSKWWNLDIFTLKSNHQSFTSLASFKSFLLSLNEKNE